MPGRPPRPSDVELLAFVNTHEGNAKAAARAYGCPYRTFARWYKAAKTRLRAEEAHQREDSPVRAMRTNAAAPPPSGAAPKPRPKALDFNDRGAVKAHLLGELMWNAQHAPHPADRIRALSEVARISKAAEAEPEQAEDQGAGLSAADARHLRAMQRRYAQWTGALVRRRLARLKVDPPADPDERARDERLRDLYLQVATLAPNAPVEELAAHLESYGGAL